MKCSFSRCDAPKRRNYNTTKAGIAGEQGNTNRGMMANLLDHKASAGRVSVLKGLAKKRIEWLRYNRS